MPNFTERAIRQAFVELLNEKPFDKVTVLDIAERCGINRNTFYYHFHDVYDLLDSVLTAEEQRVFYDDELDPGSLKECLLSLTRWARENERAIKNIYRSINRDRVENYIFESSQRIMGRYIRAQVKDLEIDEKTIENTSLLYAATAEGLVLNWLREGMAEDLADYISEMDLVIENHARATLENASKLQKRS